MAETFQYCNLYCDLKYKQLIPIGNKLLQQIKLVFIFTEKTVADIFIITKTDDVYGYGGNLNGRLGFGHNNEVKEATKITELCGKAVKNIQCGQQLTVALTENNEVYYFGYNNKGILLYYFGSEQFCKPFKIIGIYGLIIDIKCTYNTAYILCSGTGQIFSYGYWTNDPSRNKLELREIKYFYNSQIISISCGYDHVLALTDTGNVFCWGYNLYAQLSFFDRAYRTIPTLIKLNDSIFIKQISCGLYHSLLLTSDGDVISFGYKHPYKIIKDQKFQEIYAFENMSLALDQNFILYIWGLINDKTIDLPQITELSSFQEVINIYSNNMSTISPLKPEDVFKSKGIKRLTKAMVKAFNNQKYSDLTFKFKCKESEDTFQYIYAHKWFIEENSEHFQTMFSNNWSETVTNEVLITGYSYEAYYQFIRFFYTDSIESEDINILLEILSISEEYFDEYLKNKTIDSIEPLISLENVCSVYSSSVRLRAKQLKESCFKLMSENIDSFVTTDDYKHMDPIYSKQFFTEYYANK